MTVQRFSGVVAMTAVWAMLITAFAVTKVSVPGSRFYSYLWSTDFQRYFSLVMATSAALLVVFVRYVKDTYETSAVFTWAAGALVQGTLMAATVPYDPGGSRDWLHLSGTVALLFGLTVLLFAFGRANRASWFGKLSYVLFALELVVLVGGGALLVFAHTTVIEPGSLLVLSAWIVAVTAHSPMHAREGD